MEIKWLEDFVSLARTRNFSRSSKERNVTQPAFSRRIRALEAWLGADLIDRRTYPVALTKEGRLFRDTAETILQNVYHDRAQFRQMQHANRPDVRIAAANTLGLNFIPAWLKSIARKTEPFTSQIITKNFHDMVRYLSDGDVDFVLQYCSLSAPILFEAAQFHSLTLAREDMVLVSPAAAEGGALLDPDQIGDLPYIGYSKDSYFAEIEALIFAANPQAARKFKRISESSTSEFVKRIALEFQAFALVPESCAADEIARGELARIDDKRWRANLNIQIYRKVDAKRPIVRKLWTAISKTALHMDNR